MSPRLPDLSVLPGRLGVCRLRASDGVPDWCAGEGFVSITRTAGELSIVCAENRIPGGVNCARSWRALELQGPFELDEIGVLAPILATLAGAGVSILALATFETDYVLIREPELPVAVRSLEAAGYRFVDTP